MKRILYFIGVVAMVLVGACTQHEDEPLPPNANDLEIVIEMYKTAELSKSGFYWVFNYLPSMNGVRWEAIDGEMRVTGLDLGTVYNKKHTLTPRIGELTHLRSFTYWSRDVEGEWPREIYNCPLETLVLRADNINRMMKGGLCPEMMKVSETLKFLFIEYTDLSFDNGELDYILACKNLEGLILENDNLSGEVPAAFGDCNYSTFSLRHNKFTSIDWNIINGSGTAFPYLQSNKITQEVPYWVWANIRWPEIKPKLIDCDGLNGPYLQPVN